MPLTIRCKCGVDVAYEEYDRGAEVYCHSCGAPCAVPLAAASEIGPPDSLAASADGSKCPDILNQADAGDRVAPSGEIVKPSVFSQHALLEIQDRIVGEVICLCGTKLPFRVQDCGATVYCPSCGSGVQVGSNLDRRQLWVARVSKEQPAEAKSVPVSRARVRWIRSPLGIAVLVLVAVTIVLIAKFTPARAWVSGVAGEWNPPWSVAEPPSMPDEDSDPDDSEPEEGDPESAMAPNLDPDPPITLERIEQLLHEGDTAVALIQARIWLECLKDQDATEDDPRVRRLRELIEFFTQKLAPPPATPPAYIQEFRDIVDRMAEHIKGKDLKAARTEMGKAAKLLDAHPEQLGPLARRFFSLKDFLIKEINLIEGVAKIHDWLDDAAKLLDDVERSPDHGQVNEALEKTARAKHLAFVTPLTAAEAESMDKKVRDLVAKTQFGRGKRAVEEAELLAKAHDTKMRNEQIRRAKAILPGLPESKIQPLMTKLTEVSKAKSVGNDRSKEGKVLAVRDSYEDALEHFGNGDRVNLVQACLAAHKVLVSEEDSGPMHDRLGDLLFDLLEPEISKLINPIASAPEDEVAPALAQARKSFDKLTPWRASPRWISLDGAIRQRGDQLAQHAIERAVVLEQADQLAEAVVAVEPAESIGDPATAEQARMLRVKWQKELDLRGNAQAEEASWNRLQELRRAGKPTEAWHELQVFLHRFPDSKRRSEAEQVRDALRKTVESQIDAKFDEVERLLRGEKYLEFRQGVAVLESAPLSTQQRERRARLQSELTKLKERAAGQLVLLKQHERMPAGESDVLALLEKLPKVLEMDPENAGAAALLKRAQTLARSYAEKHLKTAPGYLKNKPDRYTEKLELAQRLDPDGPFGAEAKRLLEKARK